MQRLAALFLLRVLGGFCGLDAASDVGTFWHVTDFHYDFSYSLAGYSCSKPVPVPSRGEFGSGWCDSPWSLVNSSVYAMRDLHPDVDFIVWTGDTILHTNIDEKLILSQKINLQILDNITSLLAETFPDTITYPAYGNHDYFPDAQFPLEEDEFYRHMEMSWRQWVNGSSVSETLRRGGYFTSVLPSGKVRIVSLNTNLYYTSNKVVVGVEDPAGQFAWLDGVLDAARSRQEKVMIIGHVPPGPKTPDGFLWFHADHNSKLVGLLSDYTDVITAVHFGHDHEDEFKIVYDKGGKPAIPVFLAPSVTPWRFVSPTLTTRFRNPGIRLVRYDRQSGFHLDYSQYYLDLERANREGRASWELLYRFTETYRVPDISAPSLRSVREDLLGGENHPAQTYYTQMIVKGDTETLCDATCRKAIYCGMRHFEIDSYRDCLERPASGSTPVDLGSFILLLVVYTSFHMVRQFLT